MAYAIMISEAIVNTVSPTAYISELRNISITNASRTLPFSITGARNILNAIG